ncbi:hypothetical protein C5S31_00245 [ANME-1 cluster archaeon GoMg2]|nr:hypothetical protein [ANME-1 cluster archaeon GoMg2]
MFGSVAKPIKTSISEEERQIIQEMIDDVYSQFVLAVAEGRQMNESEVLELADGRIFTGKQAKELGLVDELGNFQDAIDLAAELAGIEGKPKMVEYGKKSPFESFFGLFGRTGPWNSRNVFGGGKAASRFE